MANENNSPWLRQVKRTRPVITLTKDDTADVAIVGGGISGVATSYFLLHDTLSNVILMEMGRIAHGATGHNGGQAVAAFERTMLELSEKFGKIPVSEGQKAINSAWELLYSMIEETGIDVDLQEVTAHIALSSIDDVLYMLRESQLSEGLGLPKRDILLAESVAKKIPEEYHSLFKIVLKKELDETLLTRDGSYICVLKAKAGLINSALFCEELVSWMLNQYSSRFRVYEDTLVKKIAVGNLLDRGASNCISNGIGNSISNSTHNGNGIQSGAVLKAGQNVVNAKHVVLCTNGYDELEIEGAEASIKGTIQGVVGFLIGYMGENEREPAASVFFSSRRSGQPEGYFYLARRRYIEGPKRELTSVGGLDRPLGKNEKYRSEDIPEVEEYYSRLEEFYMKTAIDAPADIQDVKRDFSWNGLMGYTSSGVRVIGPDPRNPSLIYNLGCNGIGILPSIYGGKRIAQVIKGEILSSSIFDPISVSHG